MVAGEPQQQRVQRLAARRRPAGQTARPRADRSSPGAGRSSLPASRRQADDVPAAVRRIALPRDQPALLEGVQDPDELARVERECVGDRRLSLARLLVEQRQHA